MKTSLRRLGACISLVLFTLISSTSARADTTQQTPGANNVMIQYQIHGALKGSRPLLVLVHGWSCDSNYWREQIPALKDEYDLVTLDLAGHGASAATRDDYSMRSFGEDVQRVVNSLPTEAPIILIGHSMGGPVVIEAARLLGPRVRGVIGVDTFSSIGAPPAPATQTEARIAFFEKDFAGTTRVFVERTFFRPDAKPEPRRWIIEDMAAGDPRVGIAALRGLNAWDGATALRDMQVPVIAINADQAPTDENRLRGISSQFRLRVLSNTGHFLMMEEPARFNAVLHEELDQLR